VRASRRAIAAVFLAGALLGGLLVRLPAAVGSQEVLVSGRYSRVRADVGLDTLAHQAAALMDAAVPAAARVTGASDLSPVRAVVFGNRGPFSAATGVARGNPVVGLAVFPEQVIYLDGSGAFSSLSRVVPHEVGHVMEYRAAGAGAGALPRWFNEGVAEHVAGPTPAYVDATALAGLRQGGTLPMAKLEAAFQDPDRVGLAYAESASLVEFLVQRKGEGVIAALLAEVRRGRDFPGALRDVAGLAPGEWEEAWQDSLRRRWFAAPDLNVLLWLAMVVLLLLAFVRMVRERRRRREEAEAEIAVEDHDYQ